MKGPKKRGRPPKKRIIDVDAASIIRATAVYEEGEQIICFLIGQPSHVF